MKKYYINYYNNAANTFELRWTDNKEDEEAAIAEGFKRITRKEAIEKCKNERERVKRGEHKFADTIIVPFLPAMIRNTIGWDMNALKTKDGYVYDFK